MRLRIKKVSGSAESGDELFAWVKEETEEPFLSPRPPEALVEAILRKLGPELRRQIDKARTIYDEKHSDDDLQLADPDSDFSYNPNAKPKI